MPSSRQIEAAQCGNLRLESFALCVRIRRAAIQKMNVPAGHVDTRKEMLLHEGAVAPLVARGKPHEFVDIEGVRPGEIGVAGLVQSHERVVNGERRPPGWQPEHRRGLVREFGSRGH